MDRSRLGPLVDRRQRDHVHGHVAEALAAGRARADRRRGARRPGRVLPADRAHRLHAEMRGDARGDVRAGGAGARGRPTSTPRCPRPCTTTTVSPRPCSPRTWRTRRRAWRALPVGTVKVNDVFGGAPGGAAQPRRGSGRGFGYGPELLDEMTDRQGRAPRRRRPVALIHRPVHDHGWVTTARSGVAGARRRARDQDRGDVRSDRVGGSVSVRPTRLAVATALAVVALLGTACSARPARRHDPADRHRGRGVRHRRRRSGRATGTAATGTPSWLRPGCRPTRSGRPTRRRSAWSRSAGWARRRASGRAAHPRRPGHLRGPRARRADPRAGDRAGSHAERRPGRADPGRAQRPAGPQRRSRSTRRGCAPSATSSTQARDAANAVLSSPNASEEAKAAARDALARLDALAAAMRDAASAAPGRARRRR